MNAQVRHFITSICGCAAAVIGILTASAAASADIKASSYIPTIDIFPTAVFATGEDAFVAPGADLGFSNGDVKFNGVFSQPLLNHLAFQYEYDRAAGIDTTIGSIGFTPGGQRIAGGTSNDLINEFRLAYSQPQIGVILGHYYRYRVCCPNVGDNSATGTLTPADWHATYLQLGLTSPKIAAVNGMTIGVTARGTYNLHHNSPAYRAFEAENGFQDRNGVARFGLNYGVNTNIPINSGFSLFGSFSSGAFDFFDNQANPYYYDISDMGFSKKINRFLSFSADINNLVQVHLENNNPFPYPNTIHRVYLAGSLDIHLGP